MKGDVSNRLKSLKINVVLNAVLTMSSFLFPLISFPYVSRILLPEGTGIVSFASSFVSYFVLISQLGIPTYGIRACAKVRDDRIQLTRVAHELLVINIIMCVVSYLGLFLVILLIPKLQSQKTLYIVLSQTIILNALGMEWLYKGLEQYAYITIRSVVFKFIALLGMFGLIHTKDDYVIYAGITIFAASASNILNFCNAHKYIDMKLVGNYCMMRHIKPITVFFLMTCATTIYTNLDTTMLGFMKTDIDVGYYNASVKIKNILVCVVASVGTVLMPRASYYIEKGKKEDFYIITTKAVSYIFWMAFPIVIYFVLFAQEGILFLSGDAYIGSVKPMQYIMPTVLFIGLSNILGLQMLVPMGREKTVLFSVVCGAVIDVIINMLLIPKMGASGAAIGTSVAEFVVLMIQLWVMKGEVGKTFKSIPYCKIILGTALAGIVSMGVKNLQDSNLIILMMSAFVFFSVYVLFLIIIEDELSKEIINMIKDML